MASTYHFNVTQGSEFFVRFQVKGTGGNPYYLSDPYLGTTGYEVSGVAKYRYGDTGIMMNLKPSGVSGLAQSGYFDIKLYASQTQNLPVMEGVYGIEIYSGAGVGQFVDKAVKGKFNVYPEVTKGGYTY